MLPARAVIDAKRCRAVHARRHASVNNGSLLRRRWLDSRCWRTASRPLYIKVIGDESQRLVCRARVGHIGCRYQVVVSQTKSSYKHENRRKRNKKTGETTVPDPAAAAAATAAAARSLNVCIACAASDSATVRKCSCSRSSSSKDTSLAVSAGPNNACRLIGSRNKRHRNRRGFRYVDFKSGRGGAAECA